MAKQSVSTSAREARTVTVVFQRHADDPDSVVEQVTPATAAVIRALDTMTDAQRQEVLRVATAVKAGRFNYSPAEIEAWTPEQRRAVVDSLPEVTA